MIPSARIAANLESVRNRIAAACQRASRDISEVRLVAVTKTVGVDEIRALHGLGVKDIGENRVAEGLAKHEALGDLACCWHFIGHLQRNKARKAVRVFRFLHSLDSLELAKILQVEAEKGGFAMDVLLEINIAGEESKYGLRPEEVLPTARAIQRLSRLRLQGLMTMAPQVDDPEKTRPVFRILRQMRDRVSAEIGMTLPHLSMGMSNDFEVAIEEGATMVRIGTSLFR